MQKLLITVGFALLIIGILWPWISTSSLGQLPGDIRIERDGFKFYFPVTTLLIVSAIVTAVMWFFRH